MKKIIRYFSSLLFCLKYLPFHQAIIVPIYIKRRNVHIRQLQKGSISFIGPVKRSMVSWGFETGSDGLPHGKCVVCIKPEGRIVFKGSATISAGTGIQIEQGVIVLGDKFYCNYNCYIRSTCKLEFGKEALLGWNITINTSNGHHVYYNESEKSMNKDIIIGNHVWIASNSIIGKGTRIADNCIVSQMSLVIGEHTISNSLIAGNPAKVVKEGYNWS